MQMLFGSVGTYKAVFILWFYVGVKLGLLHLGKI
jgi:hypothetical protein